MSSVEVIHPARLTPEMQKCWRQLQADHPDFASPFFSVEFCRFVGQVRDDVRIAVFRHKGEICGFFPFHRKPLGAAVPLAGQISDYHGVIGRAGPEPSPSALLGAAGISCYDFNHAPKSQQILSTGAFRQTASPLIDLSRGFDVWLVERRRASSTIKTTERRRRKIEREIGPLTFQAQDRSEEAWEFLLATKRAALAEMGVQLILDHPWVAELAAALRSCDTPEFAGVLSTLRAGDRLIAAHFGMRSDRAWHWWFPTYDATLGNYSPGLVLLYDNLKAAAEAGMAEFDLGRGDERYKMAFADLHRPLIEGTIERPETPLGAVRSLNKAVQRVGQRTLPDRIADWNRRACNRLLRAGLLR